MRFKVDARYANAIPVMRYFYGIAWSTDRTYFILLAVTMIVRGFSPFVNIILPKFLIDELLGAKRPEVVLELAAALVLANYAINLINNVLDYLTNKSRTKIDMRIDELLNHKAMHMDFEYTENTAVLTQLEKARTGISWYSGGMGGLSGNLVSIVSGAITFIGTLAIIGTLSPLLIAVLVGVTLLNLFLVGSMQKIQAQFMKDLVGINRKFGYFFNLVKNIRYAKDIRMYGADDMISKRVDGYIQQDWVIEMGRTAQVTRYMVAMTSVNALQQVVLYGYLGLRVLSGSISIGGFQMLLGAATSFTGSLSGLLAQFIEIAKNCDFLNEYRVFMDYPSAMNPGTRKVSKGVDHVIEFRDVSFRYPGSGDFALRNVSLTIPFGQRLSIVGENGAGKTTFIKLLCRLYDPTEGAVLLDGVDIREYEMEDYIRTFAVVFQDFRLLSFTIAENVAVGESHEPARLDEALEKAGFTERLQSLEKGVDTPVYKGFDEKGIEFSGGESQKLAIARAIHKDAPVAILDEPTAALDPVAEYDIYNRFDHLMGGKTAIYISHRLSSCRFCDRIAVFHEGSLTEYGTHAELLANGGKYGEMWAAQSQYYEDTDRRMEEAV